MSGNPSRNGQLALLCIGLFFILPALFISYLVIDFASTWPTDFGPSPLIMLSMPVIMGIIGCLLIIRGIYNYIKWPEIQAEKERKKADFQITQVQDPTYSDEGAVSSGYKATPTIVIPNYCSSCSAKLSYEELTWTGPMTFKCPNCGHEMVAERRGF
jgi:predicted RNA-binding Zn-ribbon protein involved in translation (DUF1610 family)